MIPVTIWVHGTRGATFLPLAISKRARAVEHSICYCPPGLQAATSVDPLLYQRSMAQLISKTDPLSFPLEHFYLFGWSGKLDAAERQKAGQELWLAIEGLHTQYAQPISITLITHSHGGNVALNIARHAQAHHSGIIKRLILLACPVQEETAPFIQSPLFEERYSLYSRSDLIHVLDPQKLHPIGKGIAEAIKSRSFSPLRIGFAQSKNRPFFSQRRFPDHPELFQAEIAWLDAPRHRREDFIPFSSLSTVAEKLMKRMHIVGRGLLHIEFIMPSFLMHLPLVLVQARDKKDDGDRVIKI